MFEDMLKYFSPVKDEDILPTPVTAAISKMGVELNQTNIAGTQSISELVVAREDNNSTTPVK